MSGRARPDPDPFRPARWVDAVARARRAVSDRSIVRLDASDLRRRATRRLGRPVHSDDLGLDVLLADLSTADLTDLGRLAVRAQLLRRIVTAEELADARRHRPALGAVVVDRPLVIVGLPRTGTTLLHCLLACDPAAVAFPYWELQRPAPPRTLPLERAVRYTRAALTVSAAKIMLPTLRDVHPLAPRQPEECVFLFRDTAMYAVPLVAFGYLRWMQGEGSSAVDYHTYRETLQVLLAAHPGRRPILKSPFHLDHLDDLFTALPDALVVHTHRDPAAALASWCSFAATIGRGTVASLDLVALGQSWLDFWAHAAERALVTRRTAAASRFHDVRYDDLVTHPLREVRRIYAAAGLPITATAEQRMHRWLARDFRRRRRPHRYHLDQFGLDATTVGARFREYRSL
jgi:hypothetical protein